MTTNVAINGFGRIGLLALRGMLERHKQELSVVAVNDMADLHTNTHLFRYDSTYGAFPRKVEVREGRLRIDDWDIVVLSEKDPSRLPWQKLGVDIVIESTVSVVDLVLDLKKSASVEGSTTHSKLLRRAISTLSWNIATSLWFSVTSVATPPPPSWMVFPRWCWTERWPKCSLGTITNGATAGASVMWQP